MTDAFDSTSGVEIFATLLLAFILYQLGGSVVQQRPALRTLGARIGMAAFLLSCGAAIYAERDLDAGLLLMTVLRGLVLGALVTGVSWLLLPALAGVHQATIVTPRATLEQLLRDWRRRATRQRDERERAERLRQQGEDYERLAPERERIRLEAQARARQATAAQKRRDEVRAQCDFLYHLYSPEIETRFPRRKYDDFIAKYLDDSQTAEEAERRGEQLRTLLEEHIQKADPRSRFKSLSELTAWYTAQQAEIEALAPGRMRSALLARLNARYAELSVQLLQELQP